MVASGACHQCDRGRWGGHADVRRRGHQQYADDGAWPSLSHYQRQRPKHPRLRLPYYGALNNADHLARVARMVDERPGHVRLVTGGHTVGERGYFYAPTVLADLRQDDALVQDEVFGPVITVQRVTDESHALQLANDCRYGLAASVWTRDHGRAMRVSKALGFGAVWINTHLPYLSEMPHGGFKHSGYGKDLSMYGLEDYTRMHRRPRPRWPSAVIRCRPLPSDQAGAVSAGWPRAATPGGIGITYRLL